MSVLRYILASGSPRRKRLLSVLVDNFEIIKPQNDETSAHSAPHKMVLKLAGAKAAEVAECAPSGSVIIAADTVVYLGGEVLGKPANAANAVQMLEKLSGKTHAVYTGVCLLSTGATERLRSFYVKSSVTFNVLAASEIAAYVASGAPLDKAGSYGVQDCNFVQKVRGSFTNVMGLPLERLSFELKEFTKGEK